MNELVRALAAVAAELEGLGRPWALVGGLAVSARAEPRTTRDVDVAVSVASDAEAEQAVTTLLKRGYVLEAAVEQIATGRLATVRLLPPDHGDTSPIVDLLFASSGIEPELTSHADRLTIIAAVTVPVASVADLIALKILSRDDDRRPQDAIDLRALLAVASEREVALAREALALVRARGFDRGRDLAALLEEALARFGRRPEGPSGGSSHPSGVRRP